LKVENGKLKVTENQDGAGVPTMHPVGFRPYE